MSKYLLTFVIGLLFLTTTIPYRIELGSFSILLLEPVTLLLVAVVFFRDPLLSRSRHLLKNPLVYLVLLLVLWSILIFPLSDSLKRALSDIRDWLLPTLAFLALLSAKGPTWRNRVMIFLVILLCNSFFGVYQYVTVTPGPLVSEKTVKRSPILNEDGTVYYTPFSAGFYPHPNGLGLYLCSGLMVLLGWASEMRKRGKPYHLLWSIPVFLALLWTFAKGSLLVTGVAIAIWALHLRIRSTKRIISIISGVGLVVGSILFLTRDILPSIIMGTFWWRVGLWEIAFEMIRQHPTILLLGNGMGVYAANAYHAQPHNLYVFVLLAYGLVGLFLTLALIYDILRKGIMARLVGEIQSHPLLFGLWMALLNLFMIGTVETSWLSIENRMLFLILLSLFIQYYQELFPSGLSDMEANVNEAGTLKRLSSI